MLKRWFQVCSFILQCCLQEHESNSHCVTAEPIRERKPVFHFGSFFSFFSSRTKVNLLSCFITKVES